MARGIVIEVIGDATSYVRAAETTIAANKKVGESFTQTGVAAKLSADATLAAAVKSSEALKAQALAMQAGVAKLPLEQQAAGAVAAEAAMARYNKSIGVTTIGTSRLSTATKEGEKDLNKLVRGGLAGSGALSALGRSLAFASTGFIAFATGATIIKASIKAAQDEAVAQRQVARQLQTSGKSWQQYGGQINAVLLKESHLAGFTKADLLQSFGFLVRVGGNVTNSLKLVGLAADISRARNISLAAASIALSKALGGSATALRRLGIIVPKGVSTTAALAFVTEKFAGQARAGTTATEKFHATLVDAGAVIGRVLLPTFNRLTGEFTNWLAKMQESGRLQQNVAAVTHDLGDAFHLLGGAIHFVDKITGSFKNTVEALLAIRVTSIILGTWIPALVALAGKFGLVKTAATEAAAAQSLAARGGAGVGAAGASKIVAGAEGAAAGASLATPLIGEAAAIGFLAQKALTSKTGPSKRVGGSQRSVLLEGIGVFQKIDGRWFRIAGRATQPASDDEAVAAEAILNGSTFAGNVTRPAPGLSRFGGPPIRGLPQAAKKPVVFASFTDTISNQLAQARAALTKSTKDDVAAAKAEIAFIKREIAAGHLKGASLIQALGAEASAISTIQSAEAAAAQKRAAQVQAAKDRLAKAFANLVDPLGVEVQLLRAEAAGKSTLPALRKLLASARKALASAKGLQQQQQALQQIVAIQQQIKDSLTTATVQFQVPAKLALRLARDTALGRSTTKDLLAIRKALIRFINTHRHNLAALTDAYNQLADINSQLGATAQTALGLFKQASTRALTEGLGLTAAQRKALRARLSQLGPGGTVPGSGTGAFGFAIGSDGRPIVVHTHVNLDGQRVADNTTRHQQKRRRRNSSQRRGPNAGG